MALFIFLDFCTVWDDFWLNVLNECSKLYYKNQSFTKKSVKRLLTLNNQTDATQCQNLPGKLGQQSAICWKSLGLFRDYGLIFFQDRKLKLSACVWKRISWNLTKFQLIQLIVFPLFLSIVWLSWNFVRFHEILFKNRCWKFQLSISKKSVIPPKNII